MLSQSVLAIELLLLLHSNSDLEIELPLFLAPENSAPFETSFNRLESVLALLSIPCHKLFQSTQILVADIKLHEEPIVDDHFRLNLALETAQQLGKGACKLSQSLSQPLEVDSYLVHYAQCFARYVRVIIKHFNEIVVVFISAIHEGVQSN